MPMGRGELDGNGVDSTARSIASASRRTYGVRWCLIVLMLANAGVMAAAEFAGEEPVAVRTVIGDGMHAFHAGDYQRAYEHFTDAIEAGTADPRSYYFRGLAALRMGRTSEAQADFTTGADRELAGGSIRRVSQSLERVQGPDRLTLERYRARARLGALQRDRQSYGRRYSTIEDPPGDVRRRRRPEDIRPELVAPRGGQIEDLPRGSADAEEVPMPAAKPGKGRKAVDEPEEMEEPADESDDPFSDEPSPRRKGKSKGMSENEAAEKDAQDEEMAAEDEDAEAERDAQSEVEAAAGQ